MKKEYITTLKKGDRVEATTTFGALQKGTIYTIRRISNGWVELESMAGGHNGWYLKHTHSLTSEQKFIRKAI